MKNILTEQELIARAENALTSGEYARFAAGGARWASDSRKYRNGQFVRNVNPHKSKTNKYCFVGGLRWRNGGGYCVVNPYGELISLDNIRSWDGLTEEQERRFANVAADRSSSDNE